MRLNLIFNSRNARQAKRQIGVRKCASAVNIVVLLNKNFTRPVLISIVIALPASVFAVSRWLEGFAYKSPLEVWVFAGSVLTAIFTAWSAVSYHSLKAAFLNPAETIKYE